jgi:hypothetical protein
VRRKAEPEYRLGWNSAPAIAAERPNISGSPATVFTPVNPSPQWQASETSQPATTQSKERFPFGNHAGETAYVIHKQGIGTAHATVEILMDWDREVQACSDEYLTYQPGQKDQAGYERCVAYAKENFAGPSKATAAANCQTGELVSFFDKEPRFYVGQTALPPLTPEDATALGNKSLAGTIYYAHAFDYQGFRVPDYSYTNTQADGEIFRKLCPNSFTGPPSNNPPELALSIDCNAELPTAEKLATEAGLGHVLNLKIIDAWDVKSVGDTWYAAKCSAEVLFNFGGEAKLEFEKVPLHGKYFLQTRVIH